MKLKLTVAALAAAFAAPMANADVTIAGTFAPAVGHQSISSSNGIGALGNGAPVAKQSNMFFGNASSRFSITSSEDLGNGMNAGAFIDIRGGGGGFTDYNANDAALRPWRYGVHIGGNWGKLEIGRTFSPYAWTLILQHPDNQGPVYFGAFTILGQTGGQALAFGGGPNTTGMHAFFRTGTGLHFTSANYGGLSFRAAYMSESNKTNAVPEATELSVSADYKPEDANYYLGAVYSTRANANGAAIATTSLGNTAGQTRSGTLDSTDTVLLLGGGMTFGDLKVGVWLDRVNYKTSGVTGGLSDISRTAFWVPVTYTLPTGIIGASYVKANDLSGTNVGGNFNTSNTGANSIQVAYYHMLSKQTQPFINFQRTSNGERGVYGHFGNVAPGTTSTTVVAGIQHSF